MTILKKEHGNTNQSIKEQVSGNSCHSLDDKKTEQKIAEQYNVSPKTVRNAETFADAVNKVAENVGVSPQKILSNEVKATQTDIKKVAAGLIFLTRERTHRGLKTS